MLYAARYKLMYSYVQYLIDIGYGTLNFQNVGSLMDAVNGGKFRSILEELSCLWTVAKVQDESEIHQVIDMVNDFAIPKKYLTISIENVNITLLRNKTINFNVMLNHREAGKLQHNVGEKCELNFFAGMVRMTSICPSLGKMYAEVVGGLCPGHMQEPQGKELNTSYIGLTPHINYNPISGSDFAFVKILAEKFQFVPNLIPATDAKHQRAQETFFQFNIAIFTL